MSKRDLSDIFYLLNCQFGFRTRKSHQNVRIFRDRFQFQEHKLNVLWEFSVYFDRFSPGHQICCESRTPHICPNVLPGTSAKMPLSGSSLTLHNTSFRQIIRIREGITRKVKNYLPRWKVFQNIQESLLIT